MRWLLRCANDGWPAAAAQFGGCSHATGLASKKRAYAQPSKNEPTWPAPAGAGCENRVCLIRPGWYLSTRPQPRPTWYGFVAGLRNDKMVAPFVVDGPM